MLTHPGLRDRPIYLDYNATTPVDPAVVDAMLPYISMYFGNPSSSHPYAQVPRQAITTAREQVASLVNCTANEIVFTGGGSESDTLAIRGVALAYRERGNHIITQQTEHPAVLNLCRALSHWHGLRVTYLPVDGSGRVDPADVEAAVDDQTILVSIMHANNETGTLQPLAALSQITRRYGVLLHTDAAQSVGKIPTNVEELGVDLLTIAGHKLYAPKGIGALYVRRGTQLEPSVYGGGQEFGRRAGTENIAFMVGLGAAAALAQEQLADSQSRLRELSDLLYRQLMSRLPGLVYLNGHTSERLPNTLNVSIKGVVGEDVLTATPEIAASTGSACHEGHTDPSRVLLAMGILPERALGALRLTLGRWSTQEEVEQSAQLLAQTVHNLMQSQERG